MANRSNGSPYSREVMTVSCAISTPKARRWPRTAENEASTCSPPSGTSLTSHRTDGAIGTPRWVTSQVEPNHPPFHIRGSRAPVAICGMRIALESPRGEPLGLQPEGQPAR